MRFFQELFEIREIALKPLIRLNSRWGAYLIHLLIAAIFFSPFLLFGKIWAANTDLLTHTYPMFLLARQNFLEGSLGLWNTFTFFGAPESVAAGAAIFSPENWILFLVPDKYFFPVFTFQLFLKFFLIGVAAYHFFRAEIQNVRWALFGSLVYQLSGWMLWAAGSAVALGIYFYYTILMALVWTIKDRKPLSNYLLLTFVMSLMLMSGNISHASYGLLGIGISFIYRLYSSVHSQVFRRMVIMFICSCLTALSFYVLRALPVIETLSDSTRLSGDEGIRGSYYSALFMIARLFNTEIFGVAYHDSKPIFQGISHTLDGWHLHSHFPAFFGVIALLLVIWVLSDGRKNQKIIFWGIYTVSVLGVLTYAQPFDTLANTFLGKARHQLSFELLLPTGFSALAALGGMRLEKVLRQRDRSAFENYFFKFFLVLGTLLVVSLICTYLSKWVLRDFPFTARFIAIGVVFFFSVLLISDKWRAKINLHVGLGVLATSICLSVFLFWIIFYLKLKPIVCHHALVICTQLLALALISIGLHLFNKKSKYLFQLTMYRALPLAFIFLIFVNLFLSNEQLSDVSNPTEVTVLATLGLLRLTLVVIIFFQIIDCVQKQLVHSRLIYLTFVAILLVEQIPAMKIHSYLNTNPFYSAGSFYPPLRDLYDDNGDKVDIKNFRVNFPNSLLQLPFSTEIHGGHNEPISSSNVAYAIASYGGFNNTVPEKTAEFVANWTGEIPLFMIPSNITDARFLDLAGVGYAYDAETGLISRRQSSLSRFMTFTRYEVVEKGAEQSGESNLTLKRLKDLDFNPLDSVLLDKEPFFEPYVSRDNGRRLLYDQVNSDHIEMDVSLSGPALVLFNDSYDAGWIAEVNGVEVDITRANYMFSAIPIPAGDNHVALSYRPQVFTTALRIASVGGAIYLLALFVWLMQLCRTTEIFLRRENS